MCVEGYAILKFSMRIGVMKKEFPGHFANDSADLKRLWDDGLIVLDTNVLLNLYRYSESTKKEFIEIFFKLKDRLWIPHQVAKEYFKNRLKVISDQAKTYDDAIAGLKELRGKFENPKQHPFVSSAVLGDCIKSFDVIIGELAANKSRHDQITHDDDIKAALAEIFEGKVGEPFQDAELEEVIIEGAARYKDKIPPGFKDAGKGGGDTLADRLAPYGDYVVWRQLLGQAKSLPSNVIFVSGDFKEDWWLKSAGKTLGPLPALVDEFVAETSKSFYMYLPDRFLTLASEYLKQDVSAQAVEEVREVRMEDVAREPEASGDSPSAKKHWIAYSNRAPHITADFLRSAYQKSITEIGDTHWRTSNVRLELTTHEWLLRELVNEFEHRNLHGVPGSYANFTDAELSERIEAERNKITSLHDVIAQLQMLELETKLNEK